MTVVNRPSPLSQLWLIGGTSESVALADQLQDKRVPIVITVTTESACKNYGRDALTQVKVTRFQTDEVLQDWLQQQGITGILDASHPFATEISQRAIRVAQTLNLSYLRFERSPVMADQSTHVTEFDQGLQGLSRTVLAGHRVLLTVGSQSLPAFSQWHGCAELYARILPNESALKLAIQSGFHRDHLIAFQPPLSLELECALWRHWDISLVISKASGFAGGEDIKRQTAQQLGIPLLVLKRPQVDYPWATQSTVTALHFGQQVTSSSSP